mmetsp:Transcript_129818/g.277091  ORF Transcript_129818/g.277091 Transcript_129818/m.277091 type:complete len:241 (+) Transcript_129818:603-1325(+)
MHCADKELSNRGAGGDHHQPLKPAEHMWVLVAKDAHNHSGQRGGEGEERHTQACRFFVPGALHDQRQVLVRGNAGSEDRKLHEPHKPEVQTAGRYQKVHARVCSGSRRSRRWRLTLKHARGGAQLLRVTGRGRDQQHQWQQCEAHSDVAQRRRRHKLAGGIKEAYANIEDGEQHHEDDQGAKTAEVRGSELLLARALREIHHAIDGEHRCAERHNRREGDVGWETRSIGPLENMNPKQSP